MKIALILGISGQDGYYLTKLLLSKDYRVIGTTRNLQSLSEETSLLISKNCEIVAIDTRDTKTLTDLIVTMRPSEIYNLSGISSVAYSFDHKEDTFENNTYSLIRLLESIMNSDVKPKFYQASSSEMFGKSVTAPQLENTPFNPVSPYGSSKALAHQACKRFRDNGLFVSCGILYNHESPIRPINFVTRKITQGIARIKLGLSDNILLGRLDARRDWGFAGDYVQAMWKMLQHEIPDDFIVASGESHSVYEFAEASIRFAGLKGAVEDYVISNSNLFRPSEITELKGNANKAFEKLNWKREISFENLIKMMIRHDLELLGKEWNIEYKNAPAYD